MGLHRPGRISKTILLFGEALAEARLIDKLFELFSQHL
jgi:IS5 family transposase